MKNLSIDGLTPEQIAELQASIENFKKQNKPTKFYKSVCWVEFHSIYGDDVETEFCFLYKSCTIAGQIYLELVSPNGQEVFEIYKQAIIRRNPSSIVEAIYEFNSDEEGIVYSELGSTDLCLEDVEISEEEYNNSHTWLTPTVEVEVVTKINW